MDRLAAAVYLAEHLKHQRKVAVKVLQPELAAVIGAERFLSEIKTTANLQHPHILPLFDSGSADGLLFYVMPYVDGETLRRLATEVAGALDYAHSHGVIHRDIKPEKKAAAYRMSSRSINAAEHHRSPGRARGSRARLRRSRMMRARQLQLRVRPSPFGEAGPVPRRPVPPDTPS